MYWRLLLIFTRRDCCYEWKTETPRMHRYGETKTTRILMATVRHVAA